MKKGINEDTHIRTMPDLLARVEEEYQKQKKQAISKQAELKEILASALEKEAELVKKIGAARKITIDMEKEFHSLEVKVEKEKRSKIEKDSIRQKDVTAGRVSLKEYQKVGVSEEAISARVVAETMAHLANSLEACRAKRLEVLQLEEKLGECRNTIRGAVIQPGQFMLDTLKSLRDFTDRQLGSFLGEMESLRSEWNQIKHKLLLTQGKSVTPGYRWDRLTPEEALAIQFDPILPIECVKKLKFQLGQYEDAKTVNVAFWLRDKSVEVSVITGRRGLLQTGQIKEDPSGSFKRDKRKY